jgi:hypothetical protein
MIYADSSFMVAFRVRRDTYHRVHDDQLALAGAAGLKSLKPS